MDLSIYNDIPKYNQNVSSYYQQNSTKEILSHICTMLLNNAPISLVKMNLRILFEKVWSQQCPFCYITFYTWILE